jgi:sugar phosphate isomerase/epimerase
MDRRLDRRAFLVTGAAAAAGISLGGLAVPLAAAERSEPAAPAAAKLGWERCCQLYTFRRFPFYEALEKIAALGFRHVEPCFFLALDKARPDLKTCETLQAAVRAELRARLAERGIKMTNFYADVAGDAGKNRKIFEFAKEMGVRAIIAEPPPEALAGIEKLCEEFAIDLGIHHHAKGLSRYWSPESILEACKGRGKRIGACVDTGHWVRSGLVPVECLRKLEGHIVAVHLKDVIESGKPEARDVPLGTGKADFAAVLKELRRQGIKGYPSIEYEHDSEKLVDDVRQCVAFVEAEARKLAGKGG